MGKLNHFRVLTNCLSHQSLWIVPAALASFVLGIGNNWWNHTAEVARLAGWLTFIALSIWSIQKPSRLLPNAMQFIFAALFAGFIYVFFLEHNPNPSPPEYWWLNFLKMSVFSVLLGLICTTWESAVWILGALLLGSFSVAASFSVATCFIPGHDFGGEVYNWMVGQGVNRAGVLNLLIYFPFYLAACLLYLFPKKTWIYVLLAISLFLSMGSCILHEARTPIILIGILGPIVLLFIACFGEKSYVLNKIVTIGWWRLGLFFIGGLGGLYIINTIAFPERPIGFAMLADARFTLFHKAFIQQLIHDPFHYAVVPEICAYPWFHNFFADVHRSSGLWAFLLSLTLSAWIVTRTIQLALINKIGQVLLSVLVPIFLVMNTSVVPEGEMQPFLIFIMLGTIAERGLRSTKGEGGLYFHFNSTRQQKSS
jgi:hypothetical protein